MRPEPTTIRRQLFSVALTALAALTIGCEQIQGLMDSDEEAPAATPVDPMESVDPGSAVSAPSAEAQAGQPTDPAEAVSAPAQPQSSTALTAPAQKFYTTYNIWYEKVDSLQAINYKTGTFIPAGTEVTGIGVSSRRFRKDAISFTTPDNGAAFTISFNTKYHPGKSIHDYRNMMFTDKPFEELTKGLSPEEIKAILEGSLLVGMSRRAVLIAYGYPPEHATPNLDSSPWKYWTNRFQTKLIHFDKTGRTISPPASASGGL